MLIVTIDPGTRAVLRYYVPRSPLDLELRHSGDPTKIFLGREKFSSAENLAFFRQHYRKFRITTAGDPERFVV